MPELFPAHGQFVRLAGKDGQACPQTLRATSPQLEQTPGACEGPEYEEAISNVGTEARQIVRGRKSIC